MSDFLKRHFQKFEHRRNEMKCHKQMEVIVSEDLRLISHKMWCL